MRFIFSFLKALLIEVVATHMMEETFKPNEFKALSKYKSFKKTFVAVQNDF